MKFQILVIGLCLLASGILASDFEEQFPSAVSTYTGPVKDSSIDPTQYGEPPVWQDLPRTNAERILLVERCKDNVISRLKECGSDVICVLEIEQGPYRSYDTISTIEVYPYQGGYIGIQRLPRAYARSTYHGGRAGGSTHCTILGPDPEEWDQMELHEWFKVRIEIFPAVFELGQFFMDDEIDSEEGPWAQSAEEAVEYIILHELGHFESYIASHAKSTEFGDRDNSETGANAFASSVLRCSSLDDVLNR